MTVLNCGFYHKFLKAIVYKEGHHVKLDQRLYICPKKTSSLLLVRDWRQMIFKFRVLLREADVH